MGSSPKGLGHRTQARVRRRPARRKAVTSLWMVPAFIVWTLAYVALSGRVAEAIGAHTENGEVAYIEAWLPWTVVTLLWLSPLLVGLGLAMAARRVDRTDGVALAALVVNGLLMAVAAGPALLDRMLHLR